MMMDRKRRRPWMAANMGLAWIREKVVSDPLTTRTASTFDVRFGSLLAAGFVANRYLFALLTQTWIRPRRVAGSFVTWWLWWRATRTSSSITTNWEYTGDPIVRRSRDINIAAATWDIHIHWPTTSSATTQIIRSDGVQFVTDFTTINSSMPFTTETDHFIAKL